MPGLFTVRFRNYSGTGAQAPSEFVFPPEVLIKPTRLSWRRLGGCDAATIEATGPADYLWSGLALLGRDVIILDGEGQLRWWGYVSEVSPTVGALNIGLSLDDLVNRVKVLYSTTDSAGIPTDAETDWVEDSQSVVRYGRYEERVSIDEATLDEAESTRNAVFAARAKPTPSLSIGSGASVGLTIRCAGYWSLLRREYYEHLSGREQHLDGATEQAMGVAKTSSNVAFFADSKSVFDADVGFQVGNRFTVTGGSNNGAVLTVASQTTQTAWTLTASTISFSSQPDEEDDVRDSANGLTVEVGDILATGGTTSNQWILMVAHKENAGHIEMGEPVVVAESGGTYTLVRRSLVTVEEAVTTEDIGTSITLTAYGQIIGQRWTPNTTGNWVVSKAAVRANRIGTPADNLIVELYSDNAGVPGTSLASASVAGNTLATEPSWVELDLGSTQTVAVGTYYWLIVSRSSSASDVNCYELAVDDNLGYASGDMKVWTGSAWSVRYPSDADLAFKVYAEIDITAQASNIIAASAHLGTAFIREAAGVKTAEWRDGDSRMGDEIEDLLNQGTSDDRPYVAYTDAERNVIIYPRVSYTMGKEVQIRADGVLRRYDLPLPPAYNPAGEWVELTDLPPVAMGDFAKISPMFVDYAEYDVESGNYALEPMGARSVFELAEIRNR